MPIKDKNLKKCHSDKRITIDSIHKQKISDFDKKKKEYEYYKKKLEELDTCNMCGDKYVYYTKKIKEYEYNKNNSEENYYLNNGLLLDKYYNEVYHIKNTPKKEKNGSSNIIGWFSSNSDKSDSETDISIEGNEEIEEDIVGKYLSTVDDKYLDINICDIDTINVCKKCNLHSMIIKLNDSEMYCSKCGYTEDILLHTDKSSFKDIPKEISYFAYKRINHFNEWIAQIQAKETTAIKPEIYKLVLDEIKKNKSIVTNDITHKQIREILKNINCNKYYEHIPHIINVITKNKKPILFGEYEEQLRNMFKEIQIPFMNNCPQERKNFLSYSYVLHKFCQLLELDNLLQYFPLLKSREKLKQQDIIWKKICNDLKWQYIPSI